MHTRFNPLTQEKGAVALATMGILLSIVSLSLWVVSQRLTNELQMVRRGLAYNQAYAQLHARHASVAMQLRTADINTLQSLESEQLDIAYQTFINSNNTRSVLFTVTLSLVSPSLHIKQDFFRFSSLFWFPLQAVTSDQSNLTQKLFNRDFEPLSASHFQHILEAQKLGSQEAPSRQAMSKESVIWVEGDWELPDDTHLGSLDAPVLVIVKNGNIALGNRASFYGLLVQLDAESNRRNATLEHGAKLFGALVTNGQLTLINYGNIMYEKNVLSALQQRAELQNIYPVPHSWNDFD